MKTFYLLLSFVVIFTLFWSFADSKGKHHENISIHYENTPIQIYRHFHLQKLKIFRYKNYDIFHVSAQNIDCGYSLEPPRRGGSNEYPQSMFLSRNKKIIYTPVYPSFTV